MTIRTTDTTIEPGVFGVSRPVLLWPRSMSAHLTDDQIEAVLLHELSHVRRRDNLTALVHGLVQAVCWFHPMVWWIGSRLIDERERACDEDVVGMGRDRRVYAESLLKTCQFCVGAPVTCMAGVTGSDLKRRVTSIMAAPVGTRLGIVSRGVLAAAAIVLVAVPVIGGAARVPQLTGTGLALPDRSRTFDAASVRQNTSADRSFSGRTNKGSATVRNMPLKFLLLSSFHIQEAQLIGGPGWLATDRFDVVAKADPETSSADLNVMMQNLLIERFAVKMHVETRNLPIYALVLARADGRLGPDLQPDCDPATADAPCAPNSGVSVLSNGRGGGGGVGGGVGRGVAGPGPGSGGVSMSGGGTMASLARSLSGSVGRIIIDRTGLEGKYRYKLRYSRPGSTGGSPESAPEIFTALQEQLGLKLEATRGPVDVLVIDSADHPVNDDFVMPDSQ